MRNYAIAHLSTVHSASDQRIFHKEARSLAGAGFDVSVVAKADRSEVRDGVRILPFLTGAKRRPLRMTLGLVGMLRTALKVNADAYHLHDPELLLIAPLLKMRGKKVVYDAHEDLPGTIRAKYWIPDAFKTPLALLAGFVEQAIAQRLDAVVVANPGQSAPFPDEKTIAVQNFPLAFEMNAVNVIPYQARRNCAVYVGGLTESRGVLQMLEAVEILNQKTSAKLLLGGRFVPETLETESRSKPGWKHTEYLGFLDRVELVNVLVQSRVGLALMHPTPNYTSNQPVKLFEYMLAGIPVVASNIPNYARIVDDAGCGIAVDPLNSEAIAEAIEWLFDHPREAEAMGIRGREAVLSGMNWEREADKLVRLYEALKDTGSRSAI